MPETVETTLAKLHARGDIYRCPACKCRSPGMGQPNACEVCLGAHTVSGAIANAYLRAGLDGYRVFWWGMMTGEPRSAETEVDGRPVEVMSDGRTVWVNDSEGYCVGRYAIALGWLDVHANPMSGDVRHCLDCRTGTLADFVASMREHHGIDLAEPLTKFGAKL